jgi:hypothetical protein
LHTLQVGAQNQKATGLPASEAASNGAPPTRFAVNCSASGTAAGAAGAVDAGDVAVGEDAVVVSGDAAVASLVGVAVAGSVAPGAAVEAVAPAVESSAVESPHAARAIAAPHRRAYRRVRVMAPMVVIGHQSVSGAPDKFSETFVTSTP